MESIIHVYIYILKHMYYIYIYLYYVNVYIYNMNMLRNYIYIYPTRQYQHGEEMNGLTDTPKMVGIHDGLAGFL